MTTFPEVKNRLVEAEFTATYGDGTTALIPVNVTAVETRVDGSTVEVFRDRRGEVQRTGPGRYGVHITPSLYTQHDWFVARWHVVHPVTHQQGYFDTDHFLREPAIDEGAVTGLTRQRTISEVASIDEDRHLTAIEINRRNNLLLRRFNGSYVAFFLRNDQGQRCPACWDDSMQRTTRSDCRRCYGTGWARPYSDPILGYCYHNDPALETILSQPLGEQKRQEGVEFWTVRTPKLKPGDFFVKQDGSRWRLGNWNNTKLEGERGPNRVRQIASVRRITPSDVEMNIPVPDLTRPPDTFVGFMTGSTKINRETGILIEASGAR